MNYFNLSPVGLTFWCLPIIYTFAFFSWRWIEKPALRYKNRLGHGSTSTDLSLPIPYVKSKPSPGLYEKSLSLDKSNHQLIKNIQNP